MKRNVFIWKNVLLRPHSYKAYQECINFEVLSGTKKQGMPFDKRRALVEYAYAHCLFYKNYYDSKGFHPSMLQAEIDWQKVPVLEKWMVREQGEMMFSDNADHNRLSPSNQVAQQVSL